ncbi:NB-ARC, partial [Dillenia turbinata]
MASVAVILSAISTTFSICSKLADYIIPASLVRRHFGYLYHHNKNVRNLKEETENLEYKRDRVQGEVSIAERRGELIEADVQNWLKKVQEIFNEADALLGDEVEDKKCYQVWCTSLCESYKISKQAKKKLKIVAKLLQQSGFGRVSHPAPHPGIVPVSTNCLEPLKSRVLITEKIIEELKENKIRLIGIHGMGGVGKTTIAKEVGQRAKELMLVEELAFAVVSRVPNVRKIQGEIADLLGLKFSEETELGRAGTLYRKLNNGKILLILDDVWPGLKLDEIGIPGRNDWKGCNILLTSRSQDVCNEMKTQKDFLVDILPEEEAWTLFRHIVGASLDTPDLHPVAKKAADECGGLPIAIVTVGNALRKKGVRGWKDAAKLLGKSAPKNIKGMHANVYSNIEISYNSLESEEAKKLFLLCCLFPEDYDIEVEYLLRFGMGLRLFSDVETIEDARDRAHSLADDLKASSLLLDGKFAGQVKMHDVIRDVAIFIASRDEHKFMVRSGIGLKAWPEDDNLESYRTISLMLNDIGDLPESLKCPSLQTLSLQKNQRTLKIPETSFEGMKELRVLDLSKISSLPMSMKLLRNLQTLSLTYCNLEDVAMLGELKTLEILNLSESNVKELPKEIGQLTCLRLLDLMECKELRTIHHSVLKRLTRLEELYMRNGFSQWDSEDRGEDNANISLMELDSLGSLVTLDIHVPDMKLLPEELALNKLVRFRISIGSDLNLWSRHQFSASLKLKLDASYPLAYWIKFLLTCTEDLHLYEMKSLRSVLYDLDSKGFNFLKFLKVENCCDLEYLINAEILDSHIAFAKLEKLYMIGLPKLKKICCHGQLPLGSLWKLHVLEITSCPCLRMLFDLTGLTIGEHTPFLSDLEELRLTELPSLKQIWKGPTQSASPNALRIVEVDKCNGLKSCFLPSIARECCQLQVMQVSSCNNLTEIISSERQEEEGHAIFEIMLPYLKHLTLASLPNLRSFWGIYATASEGYSDTSVQHSVFNEKVDFPSLEVLRLIFMENSILKEVWHAQLQPKSFCKLRVLEIMGCLKLLKVIPSNMIERLHDLEILKVSYCDSIEEIFDVRGLDVERVNTNGMLSQLRELKLIDLPMLKYIWRLDIYKAMSFSKLRFLELRKCGFQQHIFSSYVAKSFVQLQEIHIVGCMFVEVIIAKDEGSEEQTSVDKIVFPQASVLVLENLPNMTSFSQGACMLEWPLLRVLRVVGCHKLGSFASKGNPLDSAVQLIFNEKVTFPRLEELALGHMDNSIEIWHGTPPALSFCELVEVEAKHFERLVTFVSSNFVQRLKNVKSLTVEECASLREVFDIHGLALEEGYAVPLSKLRSMRLSGLPKLIWIWNMDPYRVLSLQNLTMLEVYRCGSLRNLFTSSVARGLLSLNVLTVSDCEMMEEIIAKGSEEMTDSNIVFPRLSSIMFMELPNITSFYQGSCTLEFPSLEYFMVEKCPKLNKFSLEVSTLEVLNTVNGALDDPQVEAGPDIRHLLDEKVAFPNLEEIQLCSLEHLREIWHGCPPAGSYCKLKTLEVQSCKELIRIFPSYLFWRLQKLERLYIENCHSLEEVFDLTQVDGDQQTAALSLLKEMMLIHLPKLMNICNKHPQLILSFHNLKRLKVENCNQLRYLCSVSTAKSLVKLQVLTLNGCKELEEVIIEEEENDKIEFPQLVSLVLEELPRVSSFCPEGCTLELPSLRTLSVRKCPQLKTFTAESQNKLKLTTLCARTEESSPTERRLQHLFSEKVTFPALESLLISNINMEDVCDGLPVGSLCKLQVLELESCVMLLNVFTYSMLKGLQSLEKLTIGECSSLRQVFDLSKVDSDSQDAVVVFSMLEEVKLVYSCDSLRKLFSLSIARGLVQLRKLEITKCRLIEEIIAEEDNGEEIGNKFIFPQLNSLLLKSLPNLSTFWDSEQRFELSRLDSLWVKDCPKILSFLSEFESIKSLEKVQRGRDSWLWTNGDDKTLTCLLGQREDLQRGRFIGA